MIPVWWSFALTALSMTSMIAVIHKKWWAFVLGLFQQVAWAYYSVVTEQWGFLVSCCIFTVINVIGWRKWKKEHDLERSIRGDVA